MIDLYCERSGAELWAEPLNALTNLAFIVAAALAWRDARDRGDDRLATLLLIALVVAIGVGSFLFHLFANTLTMLLDVTPILAFQLAYLWIYTGRVAQRGRRTQTAVVGALILLLIASAPLAHIAKGSPLYLPALIALTLLGIWHLRCASQERSVLLWAAALFALSLTLRSIDPWICHWFPAGTHFAWHLLNALVLYLVLRALLPAHPAGGR